jgi:hypothetical protein
VANRISSNPDCRACRQENCRRNQRMIIHANSSESDYFGTCTIYIRA